MTRTFSVTMCRQRRYVTSSAASRMSGSISTVTSRSDSTSGSIPASAATPASHCARRTLYCDEERLRGDPLWSATRVCVASGIATDR